MTGEGGAAGDDELRGTVFKGERFSIFSFVVAKMILGLCR